MLEFPRTAAPLAGRGARALNSLIFGLESLRSGLNRKGSRFPYLVVLSGAKPASAFAESALAVGSVDRTVEDRPRFVLGVFGRRVEPEKISSPAANTRATRR